jgi:hypothetical protein
MTQANDSSTPVFRTITLDNGVTITLGEPLSAEAMALMQPIGPQRYKLKPHTYQRAEEIDVQLTVGAEVQQMDFKYAAGTSYQDMLEDFEAELGPPTSQHGGDHDEVSVWQDPSTQFELMRSGSRILSTLRDLAPTS